VEVFEAVGFGPAEQRAGGTWHRAELWRVNWSLQPEGVRMGVRGVHFALTAEESSRLMETPYMTDEKVMAFVEEIESRWDREGLQETDKA
jgi:hypothetical protein